MSSKPQTTKTSTCNCKKVEISVTGVDKGSVLCHCSNCRRASGSAFAYNNRFVPCELKFLKGQDTIRTYEDNDTKSGNVLSRHFCGNCGCPMYLTNNAFKDLVVLHGGSISDKHDEQPKMDLFPENKHPWVGDVTSKKSKM